MYLSKEKFQIVYKSFGSIVKELKSYGNNFNQSCYWTRRALNFFNSPLQNSQEYELFIKILDCEVQADNIFNNDILILNNFKNKVKLEEENCLSMSELNKI